MIEEINPNHCPFCGSRLLDVEFERYYDREMDITMFNVACDNCNAKGPVTLTIDSAIEAWNERNATDLEDDTDE